MDPPQPLKAIRPHLFSHAKPPRRAPSTSSSSRMPSPPSPQRQRSMSFPAKRPRGYAPLPASLPSSRLSHTPPPRTYAATMVPFSAFVPVSAEEKAAAARLCGAPRLSSLALAAARAAAARGRLLDLSRIADDHVFLLLATPAIGPAHLVQLERHNPSRVGVLDALWARLVAEKYGAKELPEGVIWWRELFEKRKREEHVMLEKASERLRRRYSDGELEKGRKVEMTKRIRVGPPRKRRAAGEAGVVQSRISRLREEMRREREKRKR